MISEISEIGEIDPSCEERGDVQGREKREGRERRKEEGGKGEKGREKGEGERGGRMWKAVPTGRSLFSVLFLASSSHLASLVFSWRLPPSPVPAGPCDRLTFNSNMKLPHRCDSSDR